MLGQMEIIDSSVATIEKATQAKGVGKESAAVIIMSEGVGSRPISSRAVAIPAK